MLYEERSDLYQGPIKGLFLGIKKLQYNNIDKERAEPCISSSVIIMKVRIRGFWSD